MTLTNHGRVQRRNRRHYLLFATASGIEANLKSQFATSGWGGTRKPPFAFTEHRVLRSTGVLHSDVAVQVNIRVMRVYSKLREMTLTHKDILLKLEQMEAQTLQNPDDTQPIFSALKQLLNLEAPSRRMIGIKVKDE